MTNPNSLSASHMRKTDPQAVDRGDYPRKAAQGPFGERQSGEIKRDRARRGRIPRREEGEESQR